MHNYLSLFAPVDAEARTRAFHDYWDYLASQNGPIEEHVPSLANKTTYYCTLQERPVRSRHTLTTVRTIGELARSLAGQDLTIIDKRVLLLVTIYKVANHEAAGVRVAWDNTPPWAQCTHLMEKITRYHLCEEFCHLRLFAEMFKICGLETEWPRLAWPQRTAYKLFCRFPDWMLMAPAFCSEVMGFTFYRHLVPLFQTLFGDEPAVVDRLLELLKEIMVDELGHVGERRNYMGQRGLRCARWLLPLMIRQFFRSIREAALLFDIEQMVADALTLDYSRIDPAVVRRAWIPAYCEVRRLP